VAIIGVKDALESDDIVFIDVRSPKEYNEGCIPGAINIPIFDDEERKIIGFLYHNVGKEEAKEEGLKIATRKLSDIYEKLKGIGLDKKIVIYCWRGGMRSQSLVTVFRMLGKNVYQLEGGYKAYRKYVLSEIEKAEKKNFKFVVLHGYTGTGKTEILNILKEKGYPVLDLEKLANSRGSVFGSVGLGRPYSQKTFESLLVEELKKIEEDYLIVESESKRVGDVILPKFISEGIYSGTHILVTASLENRIKRILCEYIKYYDINIDEEIRNCINAVRRYIGNKKTDEILRYFDMGDYRRVIEELLINYYDPTYRHSINRYQYSLQVNSDEMEEAISEIEGFLKKFKESS